MTEADAINARLHQLLGADNPCESACTHVVIGEWTALGVANVLARIESRSVDSESSRPTHSREGKSTIADR